VKEPLSDIERQVYLYLIDYLAAHTYQPSVREMALHFGIRSTRSVANVLRSLERKGYVEKSSSRSRGLKLVGVAAPSRTIPVPCYSRIADSHPALRDANLDGWLTFDRSLVPNPDVFILRVKKASAGSGGSVRSGDLAMVDPSSPALDGALVLARVEDRAVIRIINHRASITALLSGGDAEPEILLSPASDFQIVGVVAAIFRWTAVQGGGTDDP
jgi:repressor LexA